MNWVFGIQGLIEPTHHMAQRAMTAIGLSQSQFQKVLTDRLGSIRPKLVFNINTCQFEVYQTNRPPRCILEIPFKVPFKESMCNQARKRLCFWANMSAWMVRQMQLQADRDRKTRYRHEDEAMFEAGIPAAEKACRGLVGTPGIGRTKPPKGALLVTK